MKRLAYLPDENKFYEDMFNKIQEQYTSRQRAIITFPRNDVEMFIYLPYKDKYNIIIPYIDPINSLYNYRIITLSYEDNFKTFIDKISVAYDEMHWA